MPKYIIYYAKKPVMEISITAGEMSHDIAIKLVQDFRKKAKLPPLKYVYDITYQRSKEDDK